MSDDPPRTGVGSGFAEAREAFGLADTDVGNSRMRMTMDAAREAGLLDGKTARISGRISPALIAQAKRTTGIGSDTELVEYALATLALDDGFAEAFARARGTIDPDLLLGY